MNSVTLTSIKPGAKGKVIEIRGGHNLVAKLESLGIRTGVEITKLSGQIMHGPVLVKVGNSEVAIGYRMAQRIIVTMEHAVKKILLMGNPNVGKSVIFSRLTGIGVIASNYPGTTVEFCKGCVSSGEENIEVVDVPGTYSLNPTSPAEQVAVEMLNQAIQNKDSIVVNVVDATNLERNLNLTLQLLKQEIPLIMALNLWDEAHHTGISINVEKLEGILGIPVIPTVAVTGEGINTLTKNLGKATKGTYRFEDQERWHEIGRIIEQVQIITHKHHTFFERLSDLTIHPWTGLPIALILLLIVFQFIRLIGEGLIAFLFEPLFMKLWAPAMQWLSGIMGGQGIIHNILIGQLIDGKIDFRLSFGLLTTGLFVEFAQVLPYLIAFYLILSFLEDTGYLPRLAVLLDKLMHSVGLHGMAFIPMLLGLGCNVAGALSTRVLETKRERFISATIMSIGIPCMAQTAMIFGLIGKYGAKGLLLVFGTLFVVWFLIGLLMNLLLKGESPEIFTEIPPYRLPYFAALLKKVWMRVKWFLQEATPFVLLGVLIINILYTFRIIDFFGHIIGPIMTTFLGLPIDAAAALVIGFLRKDIAVGMLVPLGLAFKQLVIASVVLAMYFPCVATFTTLLKELGLVDMIKASAIMLISAFTVGALLNLIL